ncbi:hypothetical protein [Thermopirellula anaerolimosa]
MSKTLDGLFCLEVLEEALGGGEPEIFNSDQGVRYTAAAFTGRLESATVAISMDGRIRWLDNVFAERWWRMVKYEHLYLHDFATPRALETGLAIYFRFTTRSVFMRLHTALDHCTLAAVYAAVCGGVQRSHRGGPNKHEIACNKRENPSALTIEK